MAAALGSLRSSKKGLDPSFLHGFSWALNDLWEGSGPTSCTRPVLQAQGQLRSRKVRGAGVQRKSKGKDNTRKEAG